MDGSSLVLPGEVFKTNVGERSLVLSKPDYSEEMVKIIIPMTTVVRFSCFCPDSPCMDSNR